MALGAEGDLWTSQRDGKMQIDSATTGDVTVVKLQGNLDTNSAPEAQDFLNGLVDSGSSKLLITLSGVGFVSSAGLRVLLVTAKKVGTGQLRISDLNPEVLEVFEMSGFSTILSVFPTESEALQGF
jgi:anti-anti-sigma factor